jgi:hypothetical protein
MKRIIILLILIMFIIITASCGNYNLKSTAVIVNPKNITVQYLPDDSVKLGEGLTIIFENKSTNCFVFPYNYNLIVYGKVDNNYISVSKSLSVFSKDDIYFEPVGSELSRQGLLILIEKEDFPITKPTKMIARISGHLCNDPSKTVSLDLPYTLEP